MGKSNSRTRSQIHSLLTILGLAVIVFAASAAGAIVGNRFGVSEKPSEPIVLHADSAATGKSMSFATGYITDSIEGLFVLDHLSGNIQCWVFNPRSRDVGGIFTGSVIKELGQEKGGTADYVMATGRMDFSSGGLRPRDGKYPASCICYVGDGNSGKVVGYGLYFNRTMGQKGEAQGGELEVVCRGVIRAPGLTRDQ